MFVSPRCETLNENTSLSLHQIIFCLDEALIEWLWRSSSRFWMPVWFHVSWQVLPSCIMWCVVSMQWLRFLSSRASWKSAFAGVSHRQKKWVGLGRKGNTVIHIVLSEGVKNPLLSQLKLCNALSWYAGSQAVYFIWYIFPVSVCSPFFIIIPCGGNGNKRAWSWFLKCYCWPLRWCILFVGCVWGRTEVIAMELASQ